MKELTGDLLDSGLTAIGHGVNTVGVMGAGIAVAFRKRWPEILNPYIEACKSETLTPGTTQVVKTEDGHYVYNIASQDLPGPCARYTWLWSGLREAAISLAGTQIPLGLPRIGCGIGGLEWESVKRIIQDVEQEFPGFEVHVYTLEEQV